MANISAHAPKPSPYLIKQKRHDCKLSGGQVQTATGIATTSLYAYESGRTQPTMPALEKLAWLYECDVRDFYLVDFDALTELSTSVILDFLNDPNQQKALRARTAMQVIQLAGVDTNKADNTDSQSLDDLLGAAVEEIKKQEDMKDVKETLQDFIGSKNVDKEE